MAGQGGGFGQNDGPKKKNTAWKMGPEKVLSEKQKKDLRKAFDMFDTDASGTIPKHRMNIIFRAMGLDLGQTEIDRMIEEMDAINVQSLSISSTGRMDYNDFQSLVVKKMLEDEPKFEVMKLFQHFDKDGSGVITFKNLKEVTQELGEELTDEEIQEMIDDADLHGIGAVCPIDYWQAMKGQRLDVD